MRYVGAGKFGKFGGFNQAFWSEDLQRLEYIDRLMDPGNKQGFTADGRIVAAKTRKVLWKSEEPYSEATSILSPDGRQHAYFFASHTNDQSLVKSLL